MTVTFPLTDKRTADELIKHLIAHNLTFPGNCAVSVMANAALVSSMHSRALGTARTAW